MIRILIMVASLLAWNTGCWAKVEMVQGENKIDVIINGKLATTFLYKPDMTKPALYPINTLSGILLNRQFPFQSVAGETKDHPHHFGIFFTYDEVNKDGFWGNTKTPPQIQLVKITKITSGKTGEISAVQNWVGKSGKTLLQENRTMIFSTGPDYYAIDFSMKLTAKDTAVVFNDTKEGMFSIRVADWLAEKSGHSEYQSSNGDLKEKNIWGKRAVWVRLEGRKADKKLGIIIINHPTSTNYPTFWHARAYGLFAANPLGQGAFEQYRKVENPKMLRLTLQQGQSAWFKFRVVIYDGSMDKAAINKIAAEYGEKE